MKLDYKFVYGYKMLLILLGFFIGFFFALMSFAIIMGNGIVVDMTVVTNIVIATATTTAVFIQIDSSKKQKQARVWEINKEILLNLAHSLSAVINLTEKRISLIESRTYFRTEESEKIDESQNSKIYEKLTNNIDLILNVYSSIVDKSLINKLHSLKDKQQEIAELYNIDALSDLDAYEEVLNSYTSLQITLQAFIGRIAGLRSISDGLK